MARCDLCPHHCVLKEGQTGFCHQRMNKEGSIVLKDYGAITSLSLDPIEKKPLYHFYPETQMLSVGSYGCNMKCPFCQNYTISQDRGSSIQVHTTPKKLVEVALDLKKEGNIGIAFTYNEPLISYEFIYDTFVLCKKHDLKTVIVSNGMIEEKYIKELSPLVDAWNIDLKGFREDIYKKLSGDLETVELLYEDVPDTLSQLIRTAFIPKPGYQFLVADFSAIEARVIAWLAGETWRMQAFAEGKDIYCASASKIFGVPVVKHGINGHLRQKGKVAELACGYGGSVGAMKAMGGSGMSDTELKQIVTDWRTASPHIVQLWCDVENAAIKAVRDKTETETHGIHFSYESGFLFIKLLSGRRLAYVKPRIGENRFGGDSITYEGIGTNRKWERLETYSGKLVENIVQATARDLLFYSMQTLSQYFIVGHIHDEMIIECPKDTKLDEICQQMAITPDWAKGLLLRADGYECSFYKKD